MSIARYARESKRQMGQFLTPETVARRVVADLPFSSSSRVLEPSFGDGSFLFAVIEKLLACHAGPQIRRLEAIFADNLFGVELDRTLYDHFFEKLRERFDFSPTNHHLHCGDFFDWFPLGGTTPIAPRDYFARQWGYFDFIVGNPPFGGSIRAELHDDLDAVYGFRLGEKIKKETYAFFLVKSFDLLQTQGSVRFICSDTFLTINTMKGLRKLLMEFGETSVQTLDGFSDETCHPMVVVNFRKTEAPCREIAVGGVNLSRTDIERTKNLSWGITSHEAKYFTGPTLGDYVVATSGMTIGNNELFLREICNGRIIETQEFEFFDEPITLQRELERARLGKLSAGAKQKIIRQEREGIARRNVRAVPLAESRSIELPHPDYYPYNKACSDILYAPPRWVIYWKDAGDAVLTFKKNGNWYLHGVGGQPYFLRSGLTWPLISHRLCAKLLPAGYVLDSGAPCAFLRDGVALEELYFILGWSLTPTCNRILKNVINHTRNIQSKDFERLPYPAWIEPGKKQQIITHVRGLLESAMSGNSYSLEHPEVHKLEEWFTFRDAPKVLSTPSQAQRQKPRQSVLFETL